MENEEFFKILEEKGFERNKRIDRAYRFKTYSYSEHIDICVETDIVQFYCTRIVEWAPQMIALNGKGTYNEPRGYLKLENVKTIDIYYEASTIVIKVK